MRRGPGQRPVSRGARWRSRCPGLSSGHAAAARRYPGRAWSRNGIDRAQPDQRKRGGRRSVNAATPSASSPLAIVSRYQRAGLGLRRPRRPDSSAATTSLVARWVSAERAGEDAGEAVHLGLELGRRHDAVDQPGAQRGGGVDQLAAEEQVLGHRRADEVDQGPGRGGRVDDADLGRGHAEDAGGVGEPQVAGRPRAPRRRRCSARGSSRPSASGTSRSAACAARFAAGRRPSGRPGRRRRAGRRCRRRRRSWAPRRSPPARAPRDRRRARRARSGSAAHIAAVIALRFSGRSMVRTATAPSRGDARGGRPTLSPGCSCAKVSHASGSPLW